MKTHTQDEIVDRYLKTLKKESTREQFARNIMIFKAFVGVGEGRVWAKQWKGVTAEDCSRYLGHLYEQQGCPNLAGDPAGLAKGTIRNFLNGPSLLFKHLVEIGYVNDTPFKAIKPPKAPKNAEKRPTKAVPYDLVKKVLDLPKGKGKKAVRDRAMLRCFFAGGLRAGEVEKLRVGDVLVEGDKVYLNLTDTKNGEREKQLLPEWPRKGILEYHAQRLQEGALSKDPLFVNYRRKSTSLCYSAIYWIYRRYLKRAGLDGYAPHSARATGITQMLKDGYSYREVQNFSRHSSVAMVEVYDKRFFGDDDSPNLGLKYW